MPQLTFVICFALCLTAVADDSPPDFNRQIAPLLAQRCLGCHDSSAHKGNLDLTSSKAALAGGDSGPAYRPGKPDDSRLWERVSQDEMPPKKPLKPEEKELLRRWIASGARWATDPIDVFQYTTDSRAGYDWWSLQPVVRPTLPVVRNEAGVRNPIDRFVLERLEPQGLSPAPEAGRRTLIRRVSFDLIGLPPSPDEIEQFENDPSADAYERLVDRLLASPAYGERWARHWLDVVRFGESQGFERDKIRTNSWRYRDWVVDALNSNMPYDEFVRLQLAGDVLRPNDADALMATGFLVAGPYDEVGKSQQSEAMKRVVRQDELEDLISVTCQTFLGLTVNCARCHDHKFDPIRQSEYYRLTAALGGVQHGERPIAGRNVQQQSESIAAGLGARLDDLRRQIASIEDKARKAILAERRTTPAAVKPPEPVARWEFEGDLKEPLRGLNAATKETARVDNGRLVLDGRGYAVTEPLPFDLREKTLEAWVQLDDLAQQGGGVVSVESPEGLQFDAIVFGEREAGRWMAGSNGFVRTESFHAPAETEAQKGLVHVAIAWHSDGTVAGYRNGVPYGKPYKSRGMLKFLAGETRVSFGMRHAPPGGNKMLKGAIDRARLYDRALTPEEVAASAGVPSDFVSPEAIAAQLSEGDKSRRDRLQFEANHLESLRVRATQMNVYAVAPSPPGEARLLRRGNPAAPAEVVTAGGVQSLRFSTASVDPAATTNAPAVAADPSDFGLSGDASDADRRTRLAAWVTRSDNPLFARVMANRVWHYHFGAGIVETCNDFGFNGARPSHPELLDWLACELIADCGMRIADWKSANPPATKGAGRPTEPGRQSQNNPQSAILRPQSLAWDLKRLHRLIVTSATYRQSSVENPEAQRIDAANRLLWRRNPQRLEAEAVRDAMLAAAGDLERQLGGPGYSDFTTFVQNSQFYTVLDPIGQSFQRRSLYRTAIRSGRSPFLDVFDCPDPSTMTPQRAVTTTPLQALSLFNHSFVLRMSEHLSDRLRREAGTDVARQIDRGCRLVYGRPMDDAERALLTEFVRQHGLPALCRAWLNSNEFLHID